MAIKLLFQPDPSKKNATREKPAGETMSRQNYHDMESIQERIKESLPSASEDYIRVRFIKDYPHATYRVNIFRQYKQPRSICRKGGGTAVLQPGLYVFKTFIAEKVSPNEYVFTPALLEES